MFNANPRQAGTRAYLQQSFDTDQWRAGFEYDFTNEIRLTATHYQEDKKSEFPAFIAKYDYRSNDVALSFKNEIVSAIIGYQSFNGDRIGGVDITSKDNSATFVQAEYRPTWLTEALTLSAGARREKVEYQYAPSFGTKLNDYERLNAWDIGANYRFTPELSAFTNYNKSFQAPDIDRFFAFDSDYNTIFNGFINPAKVRTINVGLNHVMTNNRLKVTAFRADLDNEIYLDPSAGFFGSNSNLDKTYKYGVEIQDHLKLSDQLSASVIYNYTRSIVDKEIALDGSIVKNKDLPGAPKHTVVANLNYRFWEYASLNLNHTWRSKAYIYNDFLNNATDKQDSYQSTNVALNYQFKNLNFYTAINNIFEHENNMQTQINAIYPVDFVRSWRVGMKADF